MICVTGLGLVTPLGADVEQSWRALLAGEFVRDHSRAKVRCGSDESRVESLAVQAAAEAVAEAGWGRRILADESSGMVLGTSKGAMAEWIAGGDAARPDRMCRGGLAETASVVGERLGMGGGPRLTVSGACASGLHALVRGVMMIQSGEAGRVLVVAAEASLHPLFVSSFRRLGVLAPEGFGCRPFDLQRSGFVMSEAAAAVCLEAGETQRAVARLEGAGIAADPSHLTRSDQDGAAQRMLLDDLLGGRAVDLVHAHGTGTPLNDAVELAAIEASAGRSRPLLYSHKGAMGHTLGAAGLVAIVINCLCHRHGIVPGNIQTHQPLPSRVVQIRAEATAAPVRRSVAIAAGFGGALAAATLAST
jgi:3-oxoacyl-[acyl-carrier-protein] synthase II